MYRKNTAGQFIHFQGVDATTGGIKSGVTWTQRRCIDGTFAAGGGTVTEDGTTGWYKCALAQADTNGNNIGYNFTGSGAVPQTVNFITTACDPTTATNFGITALPAVASGSAGAVLIDGTGTAAISNSSGKVLLQATQSGVTIPTVTTVTNQLTAAAIATGVWTDTTAGDFTTALSVGKSLMNGVALGTGLTVANLTNAPTAGDFTSTMKTSIGTAVAASAVASVTARVTANTDQWAGGTIPAPNVTGVPIVDLKYILGTVLTETSGQIAAAFKKFFNIASPTSTMNEITLVDTVTTYTGDTPQTGDAYARLGAPAGASVSADIAAVNVDTAAIKVQTDKMAFTVANQIDSNVITKTGFALTSAYDFAKGTVAMTESYAAQGATLTPAQALYGINQQLGQQAIVGTTMTVQKRDGATTAKTYTLNSATTPTSIVEAT